MRRGEFHLNLVSLADILTNAVGMLVLFAVISMIQIDARTYTEQVSVQRETLKTPVYFLCKADAVAYLDPVTITVRVTDIAPGTIGPGQQFALGYMKLLARVDGDVGLLLWARDTSAWDDVASLDRQNSAIRQALDRLDPARQYAFFYVSDEILPDGRGSGYRAFEAAKAVLQKRGVEMGWMPFDEKNPAVVCAQSRCAKLRRPSTL